MTPPRLDLAFSSFQTPATNRSRSSESISPPGKFPTSPTPISPTLRSYSDRVRTVRRPSWTPQLNENHSSSKLPPSLLQARPSGIVASVPELSFDPGSPSSYINLSSISKPILEDYSPSYPFPRMFRRLRPQPLSAFSTDTTIRSSSRTTSHEDSGTSETSIHVAEEIELDEGGGGGEDDGSLDRVCSLFGLAAYKSYSSTSSSDSDSVDSHPKLVLRASDDSTIPHGCIISPLVLDSPFDPPSPLSPFGNLALFDALSPLPTPRFDIEKRAEEEEVSALVMEKFENEGGFPWFTPEEDSGMRVERGVDQSGGKTEAMGVAKGEGNLDTPPASNPTSPSASNAQQLPPRSLPKASERRLTCSERAEGSDSTYDSSHSAPSTSRLPSPTVIQSFPNPPTTTRRRLRRSTHTIASKFALRSTKPSLNRERSASLPVDLTLAHPSASPPSSSIAKRCNSMKRRFSLSKTRKRTSQIRKSSISPPVPLHPSFDSISPSRSAFDIPRSPPPIASPSQYRFTSDPSSLSPDSSTSIDPLCSSLSSYSSQTTVDCSSCRSTQEQLEKEQARSAAFEAEIVRLLSVVNVLISPSST
ncbi:uncharacterized protein JCM6883_002344 [Sporobolomyces salmoneus]|uniref:uncharacterized protein n=1 Tax=Sporobolomyces salmoneus TaxID=183962 RepID=UPI0031765D5B